MSTAKMTTPPRTPKPTLIRRTTITLRSSGEEVDVIIQTHISRLGTDIYTAWNEECDRYFFNTKPLDTPWWLECDLVKHPPKPETVERFKRKWAHINSL